MAKQPVVDVHAHVVVPELLRDAQPAESWRPRVWREDGVQVIELGGREIRSTVAEIVDVGRILETLEARGVDRVVLSPFVPLLYLDEDPREALARCRIQNLALAEISRAHPDRVDALASVPLQNPELAADELRRLMSDGTLAGVEVTASVAGASLGDDRFEPFWNAAEETRALVFVHPTTKGLGGAEFGQYYLWNTVGNPLETAIAAAHMTMAGVMERHPELSVLLAHGGGAVLALRGRLRHAHSFQPDAGRRLRESPDRSLRQFYFDTITHDVELLRALVEFAGPDRVLLGSDYPFDMGDADAASKVRALGLGPDAEAAVLGGNAVRVIRGARDGRGTVRR